MIRRLGAPRSTFMSAQRDAASAAALAADTATVAAASARSLAEGSLATDNGAQPGRGRQPSDTTSFIISSNATTASDIVTMTQTGRYLSHGLGPRP